MELEVEESLIQVGSSDGSCTSNSDHVTRVRKLLFHRMLVGIKDGRFFLGTFHCIDKQGNIILQDAVEYRSTRRSSPSPLEQRCLGLILIPSSCRSTCHVGLFCGRTIATAFPF
ncbi:Small nuclear ribonucleoprotein family protein [Quillaja saponaria]|uniref:Small nuclear ribonucleoprotein family protein n=1 Tax=Quillaja saponaria TaxID=32244 RepID=A0AAD7M2V2_QUISA|nr:Small nuclear ribonucleoprotein family protein [Quillaja saponaria]